MRIKDNESKTHVPVADSAIRQALISVPLQLGTWALTFSGSGPRRGYPAPLPQALTEA